jgi:hypothetical protein
MIDGQRITLGGREFVAPPVPFSCMRRFADVFEGRAAPTVEVMADIVFAAMKRNYPDLDQKVFEDECLDVGNLNLAFRAVMQASHVKEAATPGEG